MQELLSAVEIMSGVRAKKPEPPIGVTAIRSTGYGWQFWMPSTGRTRTEGTRQVAVPSIGVYQRVRNLVRTIHFRASSIINIAGGKTARSAHSRRPSGARPKIRARKGV